MRCIFAGDKGADGEGEIPEIPDRKWNRNRKQGRVERRGHPGEIPQP